MKSRYYGLFAGAVLSAHGQVFFTFDYTYDTAGFFSGENSYRQDTLEAAAARVSSYLAEQSLTAVGSDGGNVAYIIDPSSNGTSTIQLNNVSVAANEIRIYVGSYAYNSGVLAKAGPGLGFSYGDSLNFEQRGTSFITPVIGTMSFNSQLFSGSVYWDQDVSNYEDPNPGSSDFDAYTFIQHELLHVLGFGTLNGWFDHLDGTNFTGEHTVETYGGWAPLSGDNAHWQGSVVSTAEDGSIQAALMTPFLFNDTRKELTAIDIAGLRDIGWNASFPSHIPEPSAFALFAGVSAFALTTTRRRRS